MGNLFFCRWKVIFIHPTTWVKQTFLKGNHKNLNLLNKYDTLERFLEPSTWFRWNTKCVNVTLPNLSFDIYLQNTVIKLLKPWQVCIFVNFCLSKMRRRGSLGTVLIWQWHCRAMKGNKVLFVWISRVMSDSGEGLRVNQELGKYSFFLDNREQTIWASDIATSETDGCDSRQSVGVLQMICEILDLDRE